MSDRPNLGIDGDEKTHVHAGWGRSGKRLILSVSALTDYGPDYDDGRQVVLTVEQAAELGRFLVAGPDA
jgi:hypothetical protein